MTTVETVETVERFFNQLPLKSYFVKIYAVFIILKSTKSKSAISVENLLV